MSYLEENLESKSRGQRLLETLKKKEKEIKFHSRRINKNTIVHCKNEDRLDAFENSCNNIKNW